jgi:hypothetical protein
MSAGRGRDCRSLSASPTPRFGEALTSVAEALEFACRSGRRTDKRTNLSKQGRQDLGCPARVGGVPHDHHLYADSAILDDFSTPGSARNSWRVASHGTSSVSASPQRKCRRRDDLQAQGSCSWASGSCRFSAHSGWSLSPQVMHLALTPLVLVIRGSARTKHSRTRDILRRAPFGGGHTLV